MEWYHYLVLAIILFVIVTAIFTLFIIPYIGYRKTFYSKGNKEKNFNPTDLPNQNMYNDYKDLIIENIIEVSKLKYEELQIKSFDKLNLYAKYYEHKKESPIEILFPGYRGNAQRDLSTGVMRAFKCGRSVVLVDQRASGKSEGHTISFGVNERIDCLYWTRFVSEKFGKNRKIFIGGVSMGAATVLMASDLDLPKNVVGILADCSYNMPKDIINKVLIDMKLSPKLIYPFIKRGARLYGRFDLESASPIESVKKSKLPIIFIHGANDDYVPYHMSEKLFNACNSKKRLIKIEDALHGTSYLTNPNKYIEELNKFLNEL